MEISIPVEQSPTDTNVKVCLLVFSYPIYLFWPNYYVLRLCVSMCLSVWGIIIRSTKNVCITRLIVLFPFSCRVI